MSNLCRTSWAACVLAAIIAAAPCVARAQEPLTLQRAIEIARTSGPSAQQARETRDAARWRDDAFNARQLPQISLSGTVPNVNRSIISVVQPDGTTLFLPQRQTQSSLSVDISQRVPFTGGQLTLSSDLTRVDVGGNQTSRTWRSTPFIVSLRQDLFRSNPLRWDRKEQDIRSIVTERQYAEAQEDVAASMVTTFFDAYAAEFALANATTNVAVNDTLFTLSKGRFEIGKIGENDLLQSELALVRAQLTLDGAKLDYERTRAALRIALNFAPDAPLTVVAPTEIPAIHVDTALAIAEARRNRSETLDLELQQLQAERRVNETRRSSGIGATVTATAGFNQSGQVFDDAYRALQQQQRFGVSVDVPLVRWGARSADINAARADERRVEGSTKLAAAMLEHETRFAALQFVQASRIVASSAKADTVASLRAEVAKNRYLIGKIGINDFYQAQSERESVVQSYVQSVRSYWQAYYRLRRLTLYDFQTGSRLLGPETG